MLPRSTGSHPASSPCNAVLVVERSLRARSTHEAQPTRSDGDVDPRVVPDADTNSGLPPHLPVLCNEVLDALALSEGLTVVDATVGLGGHAEAIAARLGTTGVLIGLDRDQGVIETARRRLREVAPRTEIVHASYDLMDEVLEDLGVDGADRVLMDLGFGSHQMDDPGRGLSFKSPAPLDMRYDRTTGPTALDLLRKTPEQELVRWFQELGEERYARRIASAICRERRARRLPETCEGFAELVVRAVPPPSRRQRLHPATRVFQALRIVTNSELETLDRGLEAARRVLRIEGRLVVISFHSLEDRRCKAFMRDRMRPLTKKPRTASPSEVAVNPRARSAKLRVAVKTTASDPKDVCQEVAP